MAEREGFDYHRYLQVPMNTNFTHNTLCLSWLQALLIFGRSLYSFRYYLCFPLKRYHWYHLHLGNSAIPAQTAFDLAGARKLGPKRWGVVYGDGKMLPPPFRVNSADKI